MQGGNNFMSYIYLFKNTKAYILKLSSLNSGECYDLVKFTSILVKNHIILVKIYYLNYKTGDFIYIKK